jgi:hypothetical protein
MRKKGSATRVRERERLTRKAIRAAAKEERRRNQKAGDGNSPEQSA